MKGKKTGGRVAGKLNKTTEETKRLVNTLVEEGMPKAIVMLSKISDPKDYLDSISKFIAYVIPKKVHVQDDEESLKKTISSIREIIYERGGKE